MSFVYPFRLHTHDPDLESFVVTGAIEQDLPINLQIENDLYISYPLYRQSF
jgi:hypothetical protein